MVYSCWYLRPVSPRICYIQTLKKSVTKVIVLSTLDYFVLRHLAYTTLMLILFSCPHSASCIPWESPRSISTKVWVYGIERGCRWDDWGYQYRAEIKCSLVIFRSCIPLVIGSRVLKSVLSKPLYLKDSMAKFMNIRNGYLKTS